MTDDPQRREDLSREALTVDKDARAFSGSQWGKDSPPKPTQPPQSANVMPGGTEHTAGGKAPEVTWSNALGMIKKDEFKNIHKKPCNRDAFMNGIVGGTALGGLRLIWGASVWSACTWAVGTFCVGAWGKYEYCMYRRKAEKEGMTRAMEIINRKEAEKQAREAQKQRAREARREAKDEEQNAQLAALQQKSDRPKSWLTFWR